MEELLVEVSLVEVSPVEVHHNLTRQLVSVQNTCSTWLLPEWMELLGLPNSTCPWQLILSAWP